MLIMHTGVCSAQEEYMHLRSRKSREKRHCARCHEEFVESEDRGDLCSLFHEHIVMPLCNDDFISSSGQHFTLVWCASCFDLGIKIANQPPTVWSNESVLCKTFHEADDWEVE